MPKSGMILDTNFTFWVKEVHGPPVPFHIRVWVWSSFQHPMMCVCCFPGELAQSSPPNQSAFQGDAAAGDVNAAPPIWSITCQDNLIVAATKDGRIEVRLWRFAPPPPIRTERESVTLRLRDAVPEMETTCQLHRSTQCSSSMQKQIM